MLRALAASALPLAVAATTAIAQVQADPSPFPCTTESSEARAAFEQADFHAQNAHLVKAAGYARQALAADPALGIARAYLVWVTQMELTPAQRQEELDRAVADASRASDAERLWASALRATILNRAAERDSLLAAAELAMPGRPEVAVFRAYVSPTASAVAQLQAVLERFPNYAPAYHQLALRRWGMGDHAGALLAAEQYIRLLPTHPNPYHTHGMLLQRAGRLDEAIAAYRKSHDVDSSFGDGAAMMNLAAAQLLKGRAKDARESALRSAGLTSVPAVKFNRRVNAALTHVMEGKPRIALNELEAIAEEQEQAGLRPGAASTFRWIALLEAMSGDKAAVSPRLARAMMLAGDSPTQWRYSALAHALAWDLDAARANATWLREAAASGDEALRQASHEVDAVIAVAENELDRATVELRAAGPAPLGRAMLATALKKLHLDPEAEALKEQVLAATDVTGFLVLARAKVRGI